jgi:glycosyltransferase involved in cell wall biosynthesis
MKKNRIMIISEVFYPEEFNINDVALSWKDKGYDVDVLTMVPSYPESKVFEGYENKLFQQDKWRGINIYRIKTIKGYKKSLPKKLLKYIWFMVSGSIAALFLGKKYDYIFGFNAGPLTAMLPALIICKFFKIPTTLWVQDVWPDSIYAYGFKKTKVRAFFLDKFVKFIYQNIDNLAVSCVGFTRMLRPYVKKDMIIHYLPNWAIDLTKNSKPIKLCKDEKVQLTFAGNTGKVQNLENIILSFNKLSDEYLKKAQLNIIGDGSELEKLKQINKKDNVIFHGKKPRSQMMKYFNASSFLIVSLVNEPIFSNTVPAKLQTYIAAKKPILAIINGETADIVKDNKLGYVANPDEIDSIRNIFIQAITTEKNVKKRFVKNCEKLTQNDFNKNNIIDQLLELTTLKKN